MALNIKVKENQEWDEKLEQCPYYPCHQIRPPHVQKCQGVSRKLEENPKSLCLILRALSLVQYCIMIICIACLIIQGIKCINKYLAKDSKVRQSVLPVQNVTFIAFTVCPSYHDSYKAPMLKKYGASKGNYKKGKGQSRRDGVKRQ